MPYCTKCGSPLTENDRFCSKCGTQQLAAQPATAETSFMFPSFPPKPSANFGNGLITGAGAAIVILGLIVVASLNAYIGQQSTILSSQGLDAFAIHFALRDVISLIGLSASFSILGVYFLFLGFLDQFSPAVRVALNRKDVLSRLGTGFISGGIVLTALSVLNLTDDYYFPLGGGSFGFTVTVMAISGLLIVAIGALLLWGSYSRSKMATKV